MGEHAIIGIALGETAYISADVPRTAIGQLDGDGNFLADNTLERDGWILERQQIQIVTEEARNSLIPREALQQEHVLAEWGIEREQPVLLSV
jgi:hypothetical protein